MDGFAYTQLNEGCRLHAYPDQNGVPTAGYGCTGPSITLDTVLTQEQADDLYTQRYALATQQAIDDLGVGSWSSLDLVRRAALVDIAYQDGGGNPLTGVGGLAGYHCMLSAVRAGSWQMAHDQCIESLNERQTPARCNRNAKMLLTGEWQPGYGA